MSWKSVQAKASEVCGRHLEGFLPASDVAFERAGRAMVQGVEFQRGHGALKKSFGVNVYWRFLHPGVSDGTLAFRQNIGWLGSGRQLWFAMGSAQEVAKSMEQLAGLLPEVAKFLGEVCGGRRLYVMHFGRHVAEERIKDSLEGLSAEEIERIWELNN